MNIELTRTGTGCAGAFPPNSESTAATSELLSDFLNLSKYSAWPPMKKELLLLEHSERPSSFESGSMTELVGELGLKVSMTTMGES